MYVLLLYKAPRLLNRYILVRLLSEDGAEAEYKFRGPTNTNIFCLGPRHKPEISNTSLSLLARLLLLLLLHNLREIRLTEDMT